MEGVEALVERSRSGDLEAFGTLVRRFQDMAHGYAYSILGDFHWAEDVAQEAFIDAYVKLPDLKEPRAFPGWFRRIVHTHCRRVTRKKRLKTVPLEEAMGAAATAKRGDGMREEVLEAIHSLPDNQREATTLFYINGYLQNEIAEFLEVPVTTVQKRLHDARKKLKERMIEMVEETLKHNVPDERFSQKVIAELLDRPNLLEVEGHPVREVAEAIRAALPDYEYVEGNEVVGREFNALQQADPRDEAYYVDKDHILRPETTITLLQAMVGRTPPVRLVTSGRVFRARAQEDAGHAKMFHQFEALCVARDVTQDDMKATVRKVIESVFGSTELTWAPHDFPRFEQCYEACICHRGESVEVVGCGMMTAETLTKGGYDPRAVSGHALGLGLERLAMLKHGIDDIHSFRQPPYIEEN
ncbi:MAG TPA: sigma-70 family RNA polymerase sigma factor [Candidatus Hydrogenedentes bacterium]|nr:sigma-70 family RNA polymerase sigma factor [Candidatus Hydrogenedentota bacterium]HIJ72936.1 sigma-70 family RNA polymerase sigma factor [Candidatus Hydrogenedentota bacterium]